MVVVPKDFGSFFILQDLGGGTDPIWWINYMIFLRWGWNHQLAERCFSDDIRDVCCLNRTLVTGSQWRHRDHWILLCYLWCQGQRTVMASSPGWRGILIYLKHEEFRTPLVLSMVLVGDKIWGYFDTLLGYPSSKNGNHRKKWVSKQSIFFSTTYTLYIVYVLICISLKKFPFFRVFVHSFISWFYPADDPIPPPNSSGKANRLACERQHYCKNQRTLNASKMVGWAGPHHILLLEVLWRWWS